MSTLLHWLAALTFLFAPLAPAPAHAPLGDDLRDSVPLDWLTQKNGRKSKGVVVLLDEDQVVMRVGSRDKTFARKDLDKLHCKLIDLPYAIAEHAKLEASDIEGRLALATELEKRGLPLEARLLYWEILVIESDHAIAHEALGHRKSGKSFKVPVGTRWYRMDQAEKLHAKFKNAREIKTTHFDIKTDLDLAKSLQIAWFLETLYQSFQTMVGAEFGMYQPVEPMTSWVYAKRDSLPNQIGGRDFFNASDRRAYIAFENSDPRGLIHEAVHQFFFSCNESMGRRGSIPGWLNEGLAEYMTRAVNQWGQPSTDKGDMLGFHHDRFVNLASAKKPYGMKHVLNLSNGDFHGSTRLMDKYAAAYSLVHYLLHGEEGVNRGKFDAFVHGVFQGKSSTTHFKKALGIKKEKAFEAAWMAYTKEMASR